MKKNLLLLIAGYILSLTCYSQKSTPDGYQLLWEITGPDMDKPSYLFGTYHTFNKKLFHFSDSVLICLDKAEAFGMEVHPDSMMASMFMQLIPAISESAQEERQQLAEVEAQMKQRTGITNGNRPKGQTWLVKNYLPEDVPASMRHTTFLDAHLFDLARRHGKEVVGLESIAVQTSLLGQMAEETQKREQALKVDLRMRNEQTIRSKMENLYYAGDLKGLSTLIHDYYKDDTAAYNAMFMRRNQQMADNMARLIREKSYFMAVGAGHLGGSDGMLEMLRKQGFRVRQVKAGFTKTPWKYVFRSPETGVPWIPVSDECLGYTMESGAVTSQTNLLSSMGVKCVIGADLPTGQVYSCMSFMLDEKTAQANSSLLYESMIYTWKQSMGLDNLEQKTIHVDGVEGREVTLTSTRANSLSFAVRMFVRDKDVILFTCAGAANPETEKTRKHFMESVHLTEPLATSRQVLNYPEFGFSMNWYKDVFIYQKSEMNDENEVDSRRFAWNWFDLNQGVIAEISVYSIRDRIRPNDDASLDRMEKKLLASSEGGSAEYIDFKGKKALKTTVRVEGKITEEGLFFLRGTQFFSFVISYKAGHYRSGYFDKFTAGFTLENYPDPQTRTFSGDPYGFTVNLPVAVGSLILQEEEDNSGSSGRKINSAVWKAMDEKLGVSYRASRFDRNPYVYYSTLDTLAWRMARKIMYTDTTASLDLQTHETTDGAQYYYFLNRMNKGQMDNYILVVLCPGEIFTFSSALPRDMAEANAYRKAQKSFHVTAQSAEKISADKLQAVFDCLGNPDSDSLSISEARSAVTVSTYNSSQMRKIAEACRLTWPDESLPEEEVIYNHGIRELFITTVATSDSIDGPKAIAGFYNDLPEDHAIRGAALLGMLYKNSPEATKQVCEMLLLENDKTWTEKSEDDYYEEKSKVFRAMRDTLPEIRAAAPYIVRFLNKKPFKDQAANLAMTAIDSSAFDAEEIEPFRAVWMDSVNVIYKRELENIRKGKRDGYTEPYWVLGYVNLLGHLKPQKATSERIRSLISNEYPSLKMECVRALIRLGETVPADMLEEIAERHDQRAVLYDALVFAHREKEMPADYATQRMIAMSRLCIYVSDDEATPSFLRYKGEKLFLLKGESVKIFLIEFGWEGMENTYYGFAGPYNPDTGSLKSSDEYLGTGYELFDSDENRDIYWNRLMELTPLKPYE